MKRQLYLATVALALASCQSDLIPMESESSGTTTTETGYEIPVEKIIDCADNLMNQLSGTRASSRKVKSIQTIAGNPTTRSSEEFTPKFYLINYDDNEGFVLMGADSRMDQVYAISDESNLDLNDTIFNEGLRQFLGGIRDPSPQPIDTLSPIRPQDPPILCVSGKPMLSPAVRKWGQRAPFNAYCGHPSNTSEKYPTGCTPLAVAQIMTYFSWPASYEGHVFDWESMKQGYSTDEAAYLIKTLGNPENLATHYTLDGSGTSVQLIPSTFTKFGYNFNGATKTIGTGMSISYLLDSNQDRHPLLADGFEQSANVRHTWVIDGCIDTHYPGATTIDGNPKEILLLHCVWGAYGKGNGYFKLGVKSGSIGGNRDSKDSEDGTYEGYSDSSSVGWYGSYGNNSLRYWYDYKPNK